MSRIAEERETTITFNEESDEALVWSAAPVFQRKMAKMGFAPTATADDGNGGFSHWYRIPKSQVVMKAKRQLSDAQRAEIGKRLSAARLLPKRPVEQALQNENGHSR
jgi:hypothetical protein